MPSKERQELIETVAQKMQAKWSGGHINWDRMHGQLKKDYLDIAEVAADTILAAVEEPTEGMEAAAQARVKGFHDIPARDWRSSTPKDFFRIAWRAMLAASALGEQSDG